MMNNKRLLLTVMMSLSNVFGQPNETRAQMLTEAGLQIGQVDSLFAYKRTNWRDTVFQLRRDGKQAKGWGWDALMKEQGDQETVMYAQWQKPFEQFGTGLLQIAPTFTSETEIESIDLIWRFFPKVEEWSSLNMQEFCEKLVQKSRNNIKASYTIFDRCYTTMSKDLATVAFEMSFTVIPRSKR